MQNISYPKNYFENTNGNSIFMVSIEQKNIELFKYLLKKKKLNIEYKNKDGNTALLYAIYLGDPYFVKKLIRYNANVNVLNKNKCSPLLVALSLKNNEIINLLIKNGADANLERCVF